MGEESEFLPLDPELWEQLPQDLLGRVISKLPFESLVTFRAVSNHWKSVVIPEAAQQAQVSSKSALLYFDCKESSCDDDAEKPSRAYWFEFCNLEGQCIPRREVFQPCSFPTPTIGEDVRLLASEGGLLFFSFISRKDKLIRDIVVCNPLTGQSKSLCPPSSLLPFGSSFFGEPVPGLVGVVVNAETGYYKLVATGLGEKDLLWTHIYDSLTCTWKNGTSLQLEKCHVKNKSYGRSTCCGGNLYWYVELVEFILDYRAPSKFVLKYNLQNDMWSKFSVHDGFDCAARVSASQIASYQGEVVLSHLHPRDSLAYRTRRLSCQVWQSRSRLTQLGAEVKLMSRGMTDEVEAFLEKNEGRNLAQYGPGSCTPAARYQYFSFAQKDMFYHVMIADTKAAESTRIVVYNNSEKCYTTLSAIWCIRSEWKKIRPWMAWAFFPSLTSSP